GLAGPSPRPEESTGPPARCGRLGGGPAAAEASGRGARGLASGAAQAGGASAALAAAGGVHHGGGLRPAGGVGGARTMRRTGGSVELLGLALAMLFFGAGATMPQEPKPGPPRADLERQFLDLYQRVVKLRGLGQFEEATRVARQALELARQLYPKQQ